MTQMKTLTIGGTTYEVVDEAAQEHIARADNPHGTTAAQVGARPDTWTPTAAEVGARSDTWLPTISEIGAAPAGYGLGSGYGKWCTDCNAATENGFYSLSGSSVANGPDGNSKYGNMLVLSRNAGSPISQIVFYSGHVQIRTYNNSVWSEWEYVNPPMAVGVEYRTTERWNGKTVYVCTVAYGTLPNTTYKSVAHHLSPTNIVRAYGTTSGGVYIPFSYNRLSVDSGEQVELLVNLTNIVITNHDDYGTTTANVTIWYTKD